jgi:hypothetical protein
MPSIWWSTTGGTFGPALFFEPKAALARLLRGSEVGILLNEHIAEDGPTVFAHACQLGAEGIVSKRIDAPYRSGTHSASKSAILPASPCSGSAARIGISQASVAGV